MSGRKLPASRPWGPASRDAAVRRVRRVTGLVAVSAAGLSGAFSVAAAHAFKGHTHKAPATAAPDRLARATVAAPQYVPQISDRRNTRPRPPSAAPAPAPTQQPAPAQQPAPTQQPVPAPAPPPPPPVTSGGS